ncbi:major facilitator superfamily domain-containing protein [Kickxella alabastrina]|uniref:major facilitator superfamily domain-containing protein n=1 Tax=Kickxella alabastrina TaxID=61397 RepID=UPI00221ED527|nr:major facilitator superfamily domain-containing protein [Kickxella alabastrina]KAI7825054.1 major facilitator superfamily domain-containing protein [Kickxella alabastrina]
MFNKEEISKTRLHAIVVGLVLLFFISALDTTILATVYIDISNEFGDMSNGIWIITSYLLANTAVQPLYGKFSDILGRFESVAVATGIFCIGSVLCAVSTSMGMLVASRAIQGIGGGGLMAMVSIIMSDVTTERDRGKYTGFLAASWGAASAVGPVLGGAIVENTKWSIIFWINLPVCVPTLIVLYFALAIPRPQGTAMEKLRRMDFLGALAFQGFIIPFIIALSWGGQGHKWASGRVLGTIGGSMVMLIVFVVIEWKVAVDPIIPLRLFAIRNVTASTLGHFCVGACIYSPLMFIPAWELSVKQATEISAGLHLLPMMGSMVLAAGVAGAVATRYGKYRQTIWACGIFIALGNSLLLLLDQNTSNAQRVGFLILTGLGLGFGVQTMMVAAQCSVDGLDMAATTTLVLFMRTFGGIMALSILSSIFNKNLRTEVALLSKQFPKYAGIIMETINDQSIIGKSKDLPVGVKLGLVDMFQKSLHEVFLGLTPFSGLLVLSTLLFAHVELQNRRKRTIK